MMVTREILDTRLMSLSFQINQQIQLCSGFAGCFEKIKVFSDSK